MWFKKTKTPVQDTSAKIIANHKATIEIVAHKEAKDAVVRETKEANEKLNRLLVDNGFTLKIYLAAGGKHPVK